MNKPLTAQLRRTKISLPYGGVFAALALVMAASTASAQAVEEGRAQPDDSSGSAASAGVQEPDASPFGTRLSHEDSPPRDELAYGQRSITLPSGSLRADVTLGIGRTSNPVTMAFETATFLSLGAAFGVTDDLELGISRYRQGALSNSDGASRGLERSGLLPFQLTKDFNFGVVTPYARFRVVHDETLQLAAELSLILPTATGSDFGAMFGVPIRVTLARWLAVDTGPFIRAIFANKTNSDLVLPVGGVVNLTSALFLLARLTFTYADFKHAVLAADFGGGYTIEGDHGPMLDLMATFGFPRMLVDGDGAADPWQLNVTAAFRLGS